MAIYNYGYPVSYQPYQVTQSQQIPAQQYSQAAQPQTQQVQNGINWVQGKTAAKAFNIPPNSNIILMDAERDYFYIKSTDASGMPLPLRTFEYKEVVDVEDNPIHQQSNDFNPNEYVTKEELDELKKQIDNMSSKRNNQNRRDGNNAKQSV